MLDPETLSCASECEKDNFICTVAAGNTGEGTKACLTAAEKLTLPGSLYTESCENSLSDLILIGCSL